MRLAAFGCLLLSCTTVSAELAICNDVYGLLGATPPRKAELGELCVNDADCVNSDVRGDFFQPSWFAGARAKHSDGLRCDLSLRVCALRAADDAVCTKHTDCLTRMCYERITNAGFEKRCLGIGSLRLGTQCPLKDDGSHDDAACEGTSRCFPSNLGVSEGSSSYVCKAYASEGQECFNIWGLAGTEVIGHTCNPSYETLRCVPYEGSPDADGPGALTAGDPDPFHRRLRVGKCVSSQDNFVDEGGSCAITKNTNTRPNCEPFAFCSGTGDTAVCAEAGKAGAVCLSNEACRYGYICSIDDEDVTGQCLELFDNGLGAKVTDSDLCEYGLHRDIVSGTCIRDSADECTTDKTCADKFGDTFYCNTPGLNAAGVCANFIPHDCRGAYQAFTRFHSQTQKSGNFFDVYRCETNACLTSRALDTKFDDVTESLTCCLWDNANSDSCTSALGGGQLFLPQLTEDVGSGLSIWKWRVVALESQGAAFCESTGITLLEIIIISLIAGCCGLVCAFVIVKEMVLPPPVADTSGDDESLDPVTQGKGEPYQE